MPLEELKATEPHSPAPDMTIPLMNEEELLERSPFLVKLQKRRLAPVRWAELVSIARSSKPPTPPNPWDCCGSSCKPCVKDLYKEELRVWQEIHPDGPEEEDEEHKEDGGTLQNSSPNTESIQGESISQSFRNEYKKVEQERAKPKIEIDITDELQEMSFSKNSRASGKSKQVQDDW